MTADPCVRHIRDEDWADIVALEADNYTDCALSEDQAVLRSRADASPGTCFVLDVGQRTIGYLLALPYPRFRYPDLSRAEQVVHRSDNLHLHDLVIAEDRRGRGMAKHLLGHLTATAESLRYQRISLCAVSDSAGFWAANGYTAHPEITLPGGYGPNAVYMSRPV
jgi:GNAT superfamily N-acetyltransferase